MVGFYRIVFGFLRVSFKGDFKERILSVCAQNGVSLWSSRLTENAIECNILVRDFKYLRALARGKGIRVHIIEKCGMPFIINRYSKRYGIAVGILIFFAFLITMSQHIWIIDINGNKKVTDGEILSACREIGIFAGIKKDSIYPKIERERLMLKLHGVAWASINIEGSRLSVNITETNENIETTSYSNLKADSDGIIEKIDVVSGTVVVKVGDTVKKGDLLVSGIVENNDGTSFVNAKGTVTAKSQRFIEISEDFKQRKRIPTGRIKNKIVLEIFGLKIPLFLGSEKDEYSGIYKVNTLRLFSSDLPIKIHKKVYSFENETIQKYTYNQLTQRLEKELNEICYDKKMTVLDKRLTEKNSGVLLTALVEARENIAIKEKILINAGK